MIDDVEKYQSIPLIYKMIAGMLAGIFAGWLMGAGTELFAPLGKFFLTCLKCIAMPLVIVNLIAGISNLDNPESFGRIGIRIILYYILTSAAAMIVGFGVATLIKPGINLPLTGTYKGVVGEIPTIGSTLLALVPSNIFKAMMEGRFDQVVIVSAVTGVSLLMMPDAPRKRLTTLFQDLSDLMNQLVHIIMILAPYGILPLLPNLWVNTAVLSLEHLPNTLAASIWESSSCAASMPSWSLFYGHSAR